MVDEEDEKRRRRDAQLASLGRQIGGQSSAPTIVLEGGLSAAATIGRPLHGARKVKTAAGSKPPGQAVQARSLRAVKAQPQPSRSRSRSPHRSSTSRPSAVKREQGKPHVGKAEVESAMRRSSGRDIEMDLDCTDRAASGKAASAAGRAFQRKDLNVQECLDSSCGGNEGRSARPVGFLASCALNTSTLRLGCSARSLNEYY